MSGFWRRLTCRHDWRPIEVTLLTETWGGTPYQTTTELDVVCAKCGKTRRERISPGELSPAATNRVLRARFGDDVGLHFREDDR